MTNITRHPATFLTVVIKNGHALICVGEVGKRFSITASARAGVFFGGLFRGRFLLEVDAVVFFQRTPTGSTYENYLLRMCVRHVLSVRPTHYVCASGTPRLCVQRNKYPFFRVHGCFYWVQVLPSGEPSICFPWVPPFCLRLWGVVYVFIPAGVVLFSFVGRAGQRLGSWVEHGAMWVEEW